MLYDDPVFVLLTVKLPDDVLEQAREAAPGIEFEHVTGESEQMDAALRHAEIIVGWLPKDREKLASAEKLRWVQLGSAGAEKSLSVLPEHVKISTASGIFGIPIAEHIFAMMLAFTRGIAQNVRVQERSANTWRQPGPRLTELYGKTICIVGLGDIGRQTAKRAKAFGMRVVAVKRTAEDKPAYVDALLTVDDLDEAVAEADHLVLAVPATEQTQRLIDARRLALMKDTAYIYNVGRGSAIDTEALVAALREQRIAGAGLDVVDPEPLPEDHLLWSMENVIVSPHRAGSTPHHGRRLGEIFLRNLPRHLNDQPLENAVDREAGY